MILRNKTVCDSCHQQRTGTTSNKKRMKSSNPNKARQYEGKAPDAMPTPEAARKLADGLRDLLAGVTA